MSARSSADPGGSAARQPQSAEEGEAGPTIAYPGVIVLANKEFAYFFGALHHSETAFFFLSFANPQRNALLRAHVKMSRQLPVFWLYATFAGRLGVPLDSVHVEWVGVPTPPSEMSLSDIGWYNRWPAQTIRIGVPSMAPAEWHARLTERLEEVVSPYSIGDDDHVSQRTLTEAVLRADIGPFVERVPTLFTQHRPGDADVPVNPEDEEIITVVESPLSPTSDAREGGAPSASGADDDPLGLFR